MSDSTHHETPPNTPQWPTGHRALYYDGRSAKARPVRIMPETAEALRISDAADGFQSIIWPAADIVPTGSLHDFPMHLRRKNDTGERLAIEDPTSRHFMENWLGPWLKQQRALKIRNWLVAGGVAWVLIALIWVNMDAVLNVTVSFIPESWEHELGRESKEQIARILTLTPVGEIPWCHDPQGTAALQRLTARLEMPMTADPDAASAGPARAPSEAAPETAPESYPGEDIRPVEISVLKSKMVNAFALPGRHIVVTSAMIEEAQTQDELAGVLAHEMGHVTERHSTKRVLRAYGIGLIFQLVAGQGELFNAMGGLGNTLVQSKFSRADEALADRLAVERMAASGMDGAALADLFERIQAQERDEMGEGPDVSILEYLNDHPSFDARIAEIRELAHDLAKEEPLETPALRTPPLAEQDWAALKGICAE